MMLDRLTHQERSELIEAIRDEIRKEVPRALVTLGEEGFIGRWTVQALSEEKTLTEVRRQIAEKVVSRVTVHVTIPAELREGSGQ